MNFQHTVISAAVALLCLLASTGALMAQPPQPTTQEIEDAKKNLAVIKEQLAQRQQALMAEAEAIEAEEADIKKTFGAQTLQGSRAQNYKKRMTALDERRNKYIEDQQQLQYDIETYNAAVKDMTASVVEAEAEAEPETSPAEKAEREATKQRIEQDRKALAAEWKALNEERQNIMAAQSQTPASGPAFKRTGKKVPLEEQLTEWNAKRNDYAKRRDAFNNAVRSYNATTGENIKTIPKP
jgi:chromosome segregation ATPase